MLLSPRIDWQPACCCCLLPAPARACCGSSASFPLRGFRSGTQALHQIAQSPLLGSSLDSFSNFYLAHIARTDYGDLITVDQRGMPWAHNLFLDVALSFGVPAALILLALLVTHLAETSKQTIVSINAVIHNRCHGRTYPSAHLHLCHSGNVCRPDNRSNNKENPMKNLNLLTTTWRAMAALALLYVFFAPSAFVSFGQTGYGHRIQTGLA